MYWFPHTDRMLDQAQPRRGTDLSEARPLARFRGWLDDDFLQNTGLRAAHRRRQPGARG